MDRTSQTILVVVLAVILSCGLTLAAVASGAADALRAAITGETATAPAARSDASDELAMLNEDIEILNDRVASLQDQLGDFLSESPSVQPAPAALADDGALLAELEAMQARLVAIEAGPPVPATADGGNDDVDWAELRAENPELARLLESVTADVRATAGEVYDERKLAERLALITSQRAAQRQQIEGWLPRYVENFNTRTTQTNGNTVDEYSKQELIRLTLEYHDQFTDLSTRAIREEWDDETNTQTRTATQEAYQQEMNRLLVDEQQQQQLGTMLVRYVSGGGWNRQNRRGG